MSMTEVVNHDDDETTTEIARTSGVIGEMVTSREAQEVKAAMISAKEFPRDETAAISRIVQSCRRVKLAEIAEYVYPRGGTNVRGASIRLAEVLAQSWGNMDFGFIELERNAGESKVMAYAWDLESNVRVRRVFDVPHVRERGERKGGNKLLTDPRDIYEKVANDSQRRVRACILSTIPRDVQELALEQCHKTLASGHKEPLIDRVRKMLLAFEGTHAVTKGMIEKRLGHNADVTSEQELVTLRGIFTAIKDAQAGVDDYFDRTSDQPADESGKTKSQKVADELKKGKAKDKPVDNPPADRQAGDEEA